MVGGMGTLSCLAIVPRVPSIRRGCRAPGEAPNPLTLVLPHRWLVPPVVLGLLLASPGRDRCWVSRDRHTHMLAYWGSQCPREGQHPLSASPSLVVSSC